jgi:hypothetical protein
MILDIPAFETVWKSENRVRHAGSWKHGALPGQRLPPDSMPFVFPIAAITKRTGTVPPSPGGYSSGSYMASNFSAPMQ